MTRSPHFRGYTRTGGELTEGRVDWREQIDVGAERDLVTGGAAYNRLEGPNLWPDALPSLRPTLTDWSQRCSIIGMTLLRAWARALGAAEDRFDDAFDRPSTLIKLVRYPGRDGDKRQGVGAHKDPGVLTLLMIEPEKAGLQVEHGTDWIDAPPVPGAFVVNIGELMEFVTDGYLRATRHRVLSPPAGASRLSIPFFFHLGRPGHAAHRPAGQLAAQARCLQDPDNVSGCSATTCSRRGCAHPDVAAIHHPDLVG